MRLLTITIPSLRWRLVTIMCLAYIVVAAVTEVVGYTTQSNSLHRQLDSRARADATILAAGALAPLREASAGQLAALHDVVASLTGAQGVSYAAVYGPHGCIVASILPPRPPKCLNASFNLQLRDAPLDSGDVQGWAPVDDGPQLLGVAMVTLSGSSVQLDLEDMLVSDLILRGVGLAIFLLLTLAIAQYILGPLTTLAHAAGDIRHGRLHTRVPPGRHSELVMVADAFNDMATALEQRIEHLTFLASAAPVLPATFRDGGDIMPTLREFCRELHAQGAALLGRGEENELALWCDATPGNEAWRAAGAAVLGEAARPESYVWHGWSVMVVPVLGDTTFITARGESLPFSREEQQVITNFAYQLGVAADNARLFASQQEALQVKDQFLSIVSHELRTPLTTIKGYAQMLRRKLADSPDDSRFALNIESQVSRLSRLVDDLLDVTRFSRGQFELTRSRMDLRPLLEDAVTRFRMVSPGHLFDLELDRGPFEGYWDRDRLEQVLNNLMGNAVKYSPAGGTVTLITRHDGNDVVIAVRDRGIGIAKEDQQRLFERFYRGSASGGNVKGLGLGLYVTRRIIQAHGGTIQVESEPGEGSEFSVTLPVMARPVLPSAAKTSARSE